MRQTLRNKLYRAAEVLRSEGVPSLWFRILGDTVYRRTILVERHLHEPVVEAQAGIPVTVTVLNENQLDEYLAFRPAAAAAEIRSRLEKGYKCFVARAGLDLLQQAHRQPEGHDVLLRQRQRVGTLRSIRPALSRQVACWGCTCSSPLGSPR